MDLYLFLTTLDSNLSAVPVINVRHVKEAAVVAAAAAGLALEIWLYREAT